MADLKPCPFCGGEEPELEYLRNVTDQYGQHVTFVSTDKSMREGEWREYYVICSSKQCAVHPSTRHYKNKRSAINSWNRRA